MARDPQVEDLLRDALRAALPRGAQLTERRMFGGLCFMHRGNMVGAASDRGLMLRIGRDGMDAALALQGVGPMEMSGRTMTGYVRADETAFGDRHTLDRLIAATVRFAAGLPSR